MSATSFDTLGTAGDFRPSDFLGCESFHLPTSEIDRYEGRLEFWDGDTETGWKVCEPTSIQHEAPCQELAQMAGRFAMLRGSRIACFGSADLVRLDATGRKHWLMQADQVLYLHPDRVRLQGPAIDRSQSTRVRAQAVASTLLARGIEVAPGFTQDRTLFAGLPIERLMAAALACESEADFRRRLRQD